MKINTDIDNKTSFAVFKKCSLRWHKNCSKNLLLIGLAFLHFTSCLIAQQVTPIAKNFPIYFVSDINQALLEKKGDFKTTLNITGADAPSSAFIFTTNQFILFTHLKAAYAIDDHTGLKINLRKNINHSIVYNLNEFTLSLGRSKKVLTQRALSKSKWKIAKGGLSKNPFRIFRFCQSN